MKMNLSMFNEDFDFEAFQAEFEESYEEEEEIIEDEEVVEDEEDVTDSEGEEDGENIDTDVKPPVQTEEANRAFADLRRQAQEGEKFKAFVQKIADAGGMTPEQVMDAYKEKELEAQAKKENVPVEVIKRIQTLEDDNHASRQALQRERFNSQVMQVVDKYKLTESEVMATLQQARTEGIDLTVVPFENVYKLVNIDSIVSKEVEMARQKELEEKKKREQQSAPPNNSGGSTDNVADVDDDVMAFLKESGDID